MIYTMGGWTPPYGIVLVGDYLSATLVVLSSIVSTLVMIYTIDYFKDIEIEQYFFPLFYFMLVGINGAFLTGDIFTLFVFFELMLISGYCLLSFLKQDDQLEATVRYMSISLFVSSFLLLAIGGLYAVCGTLNMAHIATLIQKHDSPAILSVCAVLFFIVFGTKAALVPLHFWLPDAHSSAPTPISAMLSLIRHQFQGEGFQNLYNACCLSGFIQLNCSPFR